MILKRIGYKKTIILGLLLYVLGALCFYPSATNRVYGGFVGSLFTIACGLAMLENCMYPNVALTETFSNCALSFFSHGRCQHVHQHYRIATLGCVTYQYLSRFQRHWYYHFTSCRVLCFLWWQRL